MTAKHLCLLALALIFPTKINGQEIITKYVGQLGAKDFTSREKAFLQLWKSGDEALPALEKAVADEDPEIARRARVLLKRIRFGLTPSTPSETLSALDNYWSLDVDVRLQTLQELDVSQYFLFLLALRSEEKNPRINKWIEERITGSIEHIMRALLDKDDIAGVEKLLNRFPDCPNSSMCFAGVFAAKGTLNQKIAELENSEDETGKKLLLACYRRAGNLDQALALAKAIGDEEAIVTLSLVNGDCGPYLTWCENLPKLTSVQKTTLAIIRAQEEGKQEEARKMAKALLKSGSDDTSLQALHIAGYYDLTVPTMEQFSSRLLNGLSKTTFQTERYLGRFHFPADPEKRDDWILKEVKGTVETGNYSKEWANDICYLASRLETFGDRTTARKILAPLEDASRKAGEEEWHRYLKRAPLAFRHPLLISTIEDNWKETDFLSLLEFFYASDGVKKKFWELLAKDESLSLRQRFDEMASFHDWSNPTRKERDDCWQRMIERGKNDDELLDLIIRKGVNVEPVSLVAEAMLARADRFEELASDLQFQTVRQFVYLRDWDKALHFLRRIEKPEDQQPGLVAGVLRRAGQEKEAEIILARVSRRYLIKPIYLKTVATDLHLTGYHADAEKIKRRIAMESPPRAGWDRCFPWLLYDAEVKTDRKKAKAVSLAIVISYAKSSSWSHASGPLSANLRRNLYHGLDLIDAGKKDEGLRVIGEASKPLIGCAFITDTFLRRLKQESHPDAFDLVFNQSFNHLSKVIDQYPNCHLARNSIAWLCTVADQNLEEACKHSLASLKDEPRGSYCDTLARIYRGLGDREKEVEWHEKAVKHSTYTYFNNRSSMLSRYDWVLENPRQEK